MKRHKPFGDSEIQVGEVAHSACVRRAMVSKRCSGRDFFSPGGMAPTLSQQVLKGQTGLTRQVLYTDTRYQYVRFDYILDYLLLSFRVTFIIQSIGAVRPIWQRWRGAREILAFRSRTEV